MVLAISTSKPKSRRTRPAPPRPRKAVRSAAASPVERIYHRLQQEQRTRDAQNPSSKPPAPGKQPVQVGAREQPANPLPRGHLEKPGRETALAVSPRYQAPAYEGSHKLANKVALITGGDSGIGRAVAVLFAREGCDVAIVHLPSENVDAQTTRDAVTAEGRACLLLPGDVRQRKFCDRAVKRTLERFGHLDILVNNAGFQLHCERLEDLSDERIALTLLTNVGGYLRMARAALPHLPRGGCIINTGSTTGLRGSPHLVDYSASKGAIHALTKALAQQVLDRGIRVNAVAPGPVWTPLNPADRRPSELADFGAKTAFRRAAQPEELAPAYVFLAAPVTASYITGIVLPVTGDVGAI
jgi:NAD(P)-dependent dehydrogenase (short-subunit alcohol dehydrogenase family)